MSCVTGVQTCALPILYTPVPGGGNYSTLAFNSISATDGDAFGTSMFYCNGEEGFSATAYASGISPSQATLNLTQNTAGLTANNGANIDLQAYQNSDINIGTYTSTGGPINLLTRSTSSLYIDTAQNVGVNTILPETKLHVADVTKTLTGNVAGVAQGTLSLVSTNAQAADTGASLVFGGNYINSNSTKIAFAAITGRKSNSTNSNADGYLSFLTWRTTGLTEAMRITAAGSMGLGITAPAATTGRFEASNDIVAFSTSDKRWKNNIVKIDSPLEKISQISGVEFDWIEDEPLHGNKGHDVGVIAQEIELVIPEAVQTRESGMKAVQYDKIIPLLIESIKEQQKQIDELKELVNKLTK
jgi:hypothetical protein